MTGLGPEGVFRLRIALLSTLERNPEGGLVRPAFRTYAGAMVVERQLDLALKMGCTQIACFVDSVEREVIELQRRAQDAGIKFVHVREPARLFSLVGEEDELLVMASGVLPDFDAAEANLKRQGVLALPADIAVPLGYERIDLEFAWSGVMLIPGKLIKTLGNLPDDVDAPSALMRLALQTGTRVVPLDRALIEDQEWHIDPDPSALAAREKKWIDAQREPVSFAAPGLAVAEYAGARLARDVVGRGAERSATIAAGLFALMAVGFGGYFAPALGLAFASASALFARMGRVVERVAQLGKPEAKPSLLHRVLDWGLDPVIVFLLYLGSPEEYGLLRAFVPIMLIGLLRLSEKYGSEKWHSTFGDRILLCLLLAGSAFAGISAEVSAVLALIVLVSRFFAPFRDK